jgi:hypothetical protein
VHGLLDHHRNQRAHRRSLILRSSRSSLRRYPGQQAARACSSGGEGGDLNPLLEDREVDAQLAGIEGLG